MKLLYVLPVLMALPAGVFAESTTSKIRPFIGYNIHLAGTDNLKIKDGAGQLVKSNNLSFNDNNVGDFVFGIEFFNVAALSLNASLSDVKTTIRDEGTTKEKMNEIDAKIDLYLMRDTSFKPYVSLSAGFASMDGDIKSSGMVFGGGLGCRQYVNNNFYLNADIRYNMYPEMDVKAIQHTPVSDTTMRMSELSLNVGLGYRF